MHYLSSVQSVAVAKSVYLSHIAEAPRRLPYFILHMAECLSAKALQPSGHTVQGPWLTIHWNLRHLLQTLSSCSYNTLQLLLYSVILHTYNAHMENYSASKAGFPALQARAHVLLRQKEADLSRAKDSVTQQFQADLAAAEASTAKAQQQVEQVCHLARVVPVALASDMLLDLAELQSSASHAKGVGF